MINHLQYTNKRFTNIRHWCPHWYIAQHFQLVLLTLFVCSIYLYVYYITKSF